MKTYEVKVKTSSDSVWRVGTMKAKSKKEAERLTKLFYSNWTKIIITAG